MTLNNQSDSYWDLLAETARLQGQLGEDLVAWAKMYEAGGRALQRSSRTLTEMAELGKRMEHYLEAGPPAAVTQILRMLSSPLPGLGMGLGMGMPPAATSAAGPFAQLWEAWASSLVPHDQAKPDEGSPA
jgi:hypothetical protein